MTINIIEQLQLGQKKVVENGILQVDVKQAILDQFKDNPQSLKQQFAWSDKLEWLQAEHSQKFRMCPGAWVRKGAFIGDRVILMPCFVNIGAYIGEDTMIDSGVTIGSCAQIGSKCHISSNVVVAGVLEPVQNMPVVIEDGCFIGAGCIVAEGAKVGHNTVLAAGCVVTGSTRIYNRDNGTYSFGNIPPNSVVVPGSYQADNALSIQCVIIVKQVDSRTSSKSQLNELLR